MILGTKFKAKEPLVAPGPYPAVCVGIYDLGDQESHYDKNKTSWPRKIAFTFDLPTETHEVDGHSKPIQLTRKLNVAYGKNSKLKPFLSDWIGREMSEDEAKRFDTDTLLGNVVMLNVVHSEDGQYANIKSVMPLIKGYPVPHTETPLQTFDIDNWDDKVFAALPEWVQETIKKSLQYQKKHASDTAVDFPQAEQKQEGSTQNTESKNTSFRPVSEEACPI